MSVSRVVTLEELKTHNTTEDLWTIIEDQIYDLTKFRREHPGGEEPLDEVAGKDGTKGFIDVGHSAEAKEMMKKYLIGKLPEHETKKFKKEILLRRDIGIAVGAVILGFAVVFAIKKFKT